MDESSLPWRHMTIAQLASNSLRNGESCRLSETKQFRPPRARVRQAHHEIKIRDHPLFGRTDSQATDRNNGH